MGETVYMLGAGVNQAVKDWYGLSPPLLNNFFNIALNHPKFNNDAYTDKMKDVYGFIEKYWGMTRDNLVESSFDLELCFTLLEQQMKKAEHENRTQDAEDLFMISFRLKSFLAEILSEFEHFASISHTLRNLSKVILHEEPTIISFNYDCLIESVLESASGVNPNIPNSFRHFGTDKEKELPDEMLVYSHSIWNRPLGYGFRFDEIQLQQAGISKYVEGSRFYSLKENQLYHKPLLKLHGSLNWFRYLPIRVFPTLPWESEPKLNGREKEIILKRGTWWFGNAPDHEGWLIDPVIITPILYKNDYYDRKPFNEIWKIAKDVLSQCEKLVIIGYSFSPTDFETKQLLLESLNKKNLKELIVVNPDHNLVKTTREICGFKGGIIWYSNLDEYLQTFSSIIRIESKPAKIKESELPVDTTPHDLYLKCKTCNIEFPAGIRTNPRSHATSQYIGNMHTCPNGHSNSYDKEDYMLKKVL